VAAFRVQELVSRIARRDVGRAEATFQADTRSLLLERDFELESRQIRSIELEVPLEDGSRRAGLT
jgi:hypothetical protein